MTWLAPHTFVDGDEESDSEARHALADLVRAWRTVDPTVPDLDLTNAGSANFFVAAIGALGHSLKYAGSADWREAIRARQSIPDKFVVELSKRWDISPARAGGRRPGSGSFASRDQFLEAVRYAVRHLHSKGQKCTQAKVAEYFCNRPNFPDCEERQLRRWTRNFDFASWKDLIDAINPVT